VLSRETEYPVWYFGISTPGSFKIQQKTDLVLKQDDSAKEEQKQRGIETSDRS
jgi:hypothetical protein